jgi:hypothetical protein
MCLFLASVHAAKVCFRIALQIEHRANLPQVGARTKKRGRSVRTTGGPNRDSNLHPLCECCESSKAQADMQAKSRVYSKRLRHAGIKLAPKRRPPPATFASGWRHRMDGQWERRSKLSRSYS